MPVWGADSQRVVLRLGLLLLALLLFAAPAQAAYSVQSWTDCGGGYNSGSFDDAGNLYVACDRPASLRVYGPDGALKSQSAVGHRVNDVAPSPDGVYVYIASIEADLKRMVRQGDGSYAVDAGWSAGSYDVYGTPKPPRGLYLDTDSAGNIYLSIGAWIDGALHAIVKYSPSGTKITQFGEYTFGDCGQGKMDPAGWALGQFCWMLTGVAALGDGSVVYTTEVGNNRVQKWTRNPNGTYSAVDSFGGTQANDPNRAGGDCAFTAGQEPDAFSAPYDVGADAAGNVYVMNTTCHDVVKMSSNMLVIETIDLGDDSTGARPHGFAVAANGNVCIGESQKVIVQPGTTAPCTPAPAGGGTSDGGTGTGTTDPGTGGTGGDAGDGGQEAIPPKDLTPPRVIVQARPRQRLVRQRGVRFTVQCDEPCRFSATGRVRIGKTVIRLTRTVIDASPNRPFSVRLTVNRRALPTIRRALNRRKRVIATIEVRGKDASGNAAPLNRTSIRVIR